MTIKELLDVIPYNPTESLIFVVDTYEFTIDELYLEPLLVEQDIIKLRFEGKIQPLDEEDIIQIGIDGAVLDSNRDAIGLLFPNTSQYHMIFIHVTV